MGRQIHPVKLRGTVDNLTFYKMDGIYYIRKKSSLSRHKVLTAPCFEKTRMHAAQLKLASKIGSKMYRPLNKEQKCIDLYRAIVGRAKTLLHKGKTKQEIKQIIKAEFITQLSCLSLSYSLKPKATNKIIYGLAKATTIPSFPDFYIDSTCKIKLKTNLKSEIVNLKSITPLQGLGVWLTYELLGATFERIILKSV